MYVYCVYPAMSKMSENLSDLNKKDRNKRHSSPFINVVNGVFFVVRVTLVPVSYLSPPSVVSKSGNPGPGPVPNSYFLYYIFIKALILIKFEHNA